MNTGAGPSKNTGASRITGAGRSIIASRNGSQHRCQQESRYLHRLAGAGRFPNAHSYLGQPDIYPDSTFQGATMPSGVPTSQPMPGIGASNHGAGVDPVMGVVLSGIAQLQGVVGEMNKKKLDPGVPEQVKPGVSTLPQLPDPSPESALAFSDWMHNVQPAMADLSVTPRWICGAC